MPDCKYGNSSCYLLQGFTLIELMMSLSVLALLLSVGVPSFNFLVTKSQAITHRDHLVTSLMLARSEAAKRGAYITVCPSQNFSSCLSGTDWSSGWMVFVDVDGDGNFDTGNDELLRAVEAIGGNLAVSWTASDSTKTIRYNSRGFIRDGGGEFSICPDSDKSAIRRGLKLSSTGRPYTTEGSSVTCS